MLTLAQIGPGSPACDVGAGTGHLTCELARRGLAVTAVEPNDAMRANGIETTKSLNLDNVRWAIGTGEDTGQPSASFDIVTFGSSFNVTRRESALAETRRILRPAGWFACMWNHRDLNDPVQHDIEQIIHDRVQGYDYGSRREDQTAVIQASGLFGPVRQVEGTVDHDQSIEDCIEAWRSHATLERQAGPSFTAVVEAIEQYLRKLGRPSITIRYTTRIWMAQL